MTEPYKKYTIKDLVLAFKEAGYPVSKSTIFRWELKGNLIIPRSTTNFKKTQGNRKLGFIRVMSEGQIENIVKEFSPGGSGYYDYRKAL